MCNALSQLSQCFVTCTLLGSVETRLLQNSKAFCSLLHKWSAIAVKPLHEQHPCKEASPHAAYNSKQLMVSMHKTMRMEMMETHIRAEMARCILKRRVTSNMPASVRNGVQLCLAPSCSVPFRQPLLGLRQS